MLGTAGTRGKSSKKSSIGLPKYQTSVGSKASNSVLNPTNFPRKLRKADQGMGVVGIRNSWEGDVDLQADGTGRPTS